MGTFVGFAASVIAARLMRNEALGNAMLARVLAGTRTVLEACGSNPRTILPARRNCLTRKEQRSYAYPKYGSAEKTAKTGPFNQPIIINILVTSNLCVTQIAVKYS
jgi:hypothetical protein